MNKVYANLVLERATISTNLQTPPQLYYRLWRAGGYTDKTEQIIIQEGATGVTS